jgi:hypothetical protein
MSTPESPGAEQPRAPRSAFSFGGEQAGYLGPDGVSSGGSARPGSDAPPARGRGAGAPRRGRRQARLLVGVAALAAVAVAAVVGLTGGGGSSGSSAGSPSSLARAAYVTSSTPGVQFRFTVTGSVAGHSVSLQSHGSIDEATLEGTEAIEVEGQRLEEVIKKPYVYLHLPSDAIALFGGKAWARTNLGDYTRSLGAPNPFQQNGAIPTQMLRMLGASGTVSSLGGEQVEGVETTHYHALVDFARYATEAPAAQRGALQTYAHTLARLTGTSALPVDVWVDRQGRVRRFSTEVQACTSAGTLHEQMTMDLYGFGPQQPVTVPAPSEVTDLTGTLDAKTAQALSQVGCR